MTGQWKSICAAAMLALSACATGYDVPRTGPWTDNFNDPGDPAMPYDVRKFIIRAQGCIHFAGEEGYDAERAAFLKKMTDELCTGLKERGDRLTRKYSDRPDIRATISELLSSL